MKTLILLLTLVTTSAFAQDFTTCKTGDINLLKSTSATRNPMMNLLLNDVIIPEIETCEVSKPRYIHPAVCGAHITQVDTFKIKTMDQAEYTLTVDSSYRSCYRIRVIPMLTKLTYEVAK